MSTGSPPPDGGSPRSHRAAAPASVSALWLGGLAAVTAAVLVLVAVGVVGWLRPHHDTAAGGPSASSLGSSPSPSPSGSPSASRSPSSHPTTSSSAKPSSKPSSKPSTSTSATPTHSSTPAPAVPRDYPVVVLNETRIVGLAARVAEQLRHIGWQVTGVANWRGAIPESTVYYPSGHYSRAQRLAADLGITRIRMRVAGMLPDRLTVVLHDPPG